MYMLIATIDWADDREVIEHRHDRGGEAARPTGRQAHLQHVREGETALYMETKEHQRREAASDTDANTRAPTLRRKGSERENMLAGAHAHDFLWQRGGQGTT